MYTLEINPNGALVPVKYLAQDGREFTIKSKVALFGQELGFLILRDLVQGEIFVDTQAEVCHKAVEVQ